jgi:hypothetical protein
MMVAYVAWKDLSAADRKKCVEILNELPGKEDSILRGMPQGLSDEKRDMFMFMMAATWPDIIRSGTDPLHKAEHRPTWHYINIPIDFEGAAHDVPSTDLQTGGKPANVIQAMTFCEEVVRNAAAKPERRAIALCWLLHLMGDIHQPLHASAFFSKNFPEGDRGGNLFIVNNNGHDGPIHSLWDSLPGSSRVPTTAAKRGEEWRSDPDLSRAAFAAEIAKKKYTDWMDESVKAARDTAYDGGKVRGANEELIKEGAAVSVPTLPAGYTQDALSVAQQRVVLAGYRAKDKIADMLKPQPVPVPVP